MTGAGSGSLAFGKTDGFLGSLQDTDSDGNPEYFEPGIDPTIGELSLNRNPSRLRKPDEVFPNTSVAGNIEGSFEVEFVPETDRVGDVHDILYNNASGSGDILAAGIPATSRWFVGIDYISGTAERVLLGCVPESVDISYTQGESVRYSVTFLYADERYETDITPTSIKQASGDTAQFHSADLSLDGTIQSKEQSFTLSLSGLSRLQYGSDAVAEGASVAAPEAGLDVETILTETDQLELAYGGSGSTSTSDRLTAVSGDLTLTVNGSQLAQYNLSDMKLENNDWSEVVSEEDALESYTAQVNGVSLA